MNDKHEYEVRLNWLSARMGVLSSPALEESVSVATPPEFPGGMPGIWSPEHLFVAAISSCLMTTFLAVAEKSRLNYKQFTCSAVGSLQMKDGVYMITDVTLKPHVVITTVDDQEKALRVLEKAEKHCLISNSVKSVIHFQPEIEVDALLRSA